MRSGYSELKHLTDLEILKLFGKKNKTIIIFSTVKLVVLCYREDENYNINCQNFPSSVYIASVMYWKKIIQDFLSSIKVAYGFLSSWMWFKVP